MLEEYCGRSYPVGFWESVLLPRRVKNYSEKQLDTLLAQGDYFWQMLPGGCLSFCRYEDIREKSQEAGSSFSKLLINELFISFQISCIGRLGIPVNILIAAKTQTSLHCHPNP